MNYKDIFNHIVNNLIKYTKDNDIKSLVLGLSGGIDSTLCAIICHEVCKRTENLRFIGISLPTCTNKPDENDIAMNLTSLCHQFEMRLIDEEYQNVRKMVGQYADSSGIKITSLQEGNIKARLRMIYLYNMASLNHGIVIDTDNLTEHYLGFYTLHGDVGDVAPIGNLWKSEVYSLAKWCMENLDLLPDIKKTLQKAIDITPTDGNGVKDGGDLAQIAPGLTYYNVDEILKNEVLCSELSIQNDTRHALEIKYGKEVVSGVINRYKNSEYKRKRLPIRLDTF